MAPRAQRMTPPYVQITDHFRGQITKGKLADGQRLPTIIEIAKEWGVATATASKAISRLQVEGYVKTSPQGTFVSAAERTAFAPQDRIRAIRQTGVIYPPSERSVILAAEVVPMPDYVADIFGVDHGGQVLRRERMTSAAETPVELSVTWMLAHLVEAVPELASTERIPGGTVARVEAATGRRLNHGTDYVEAREADEREAAALNLPVGTPLLATANVWSDEHGVVEYGECVRPPKRSIRYDYEIVDA
jgi:GntR family transcriptional regulator